MIKTIGLIALSITLLAGCGIFESEKEPTETAPPSTTNKGNEGTSESGNENSEASNTAAKNWNSKAGITRLLSEGAYEDWPAEKKVHQSSGPHGMVRTFVNPILFESLSDNNETHPVGSISVKELYNSAGTKITGYAVEVKQSDGSKGDDWLWYEDLGVGDGDVEYYGLGLSLCAGCHARGTDYVTTSASQLFE